MFHLVMNDSRQQIDAMKANPPLESETRIQPSTDRMPITMPSIAGQGLALPPVSPRKQKLIRLQKAYGNQAVLRMLERSWPAIQPKPDINEPGDASYEQEADHVAEQVMRIPDSEPSIASAPLQVSRKCATCEAEDKKKLQMKSAGTPNVAGRKAPLIMHEALRSPGESLDAATRTFFESRFGYDFSEVRVHTDEKAAASTRAVGALAYTVGSHIAFATRRFAPSSNRGRHLIAHELVHVLQQSQGDPIPLQRWTYEDSCGSFLDALSNADDTAKDMVQAAIDSLLISPLESRTKNALFAYFRIRESSPNMSDLISAIVGVYEQISSHFSASDYDYECNCELPQ